MPAAKMFSGCFENRTKHRHDREIKYDFFNRMLQFISAYFGRKNFEQQKAKNVQCTNRLFW
jgi:hypothetical protein